MKTINALSLAILSVTATGLGTVQAAHADDYVTQSDFKQSQKDQDDAFNAQNKDNRAEFDELRRADVDSDNWHNQQVDDLWKDQKRQDNDVDEIRKQVADEHNYSAQERQRAETAAEEDNAETNRRVDGVEAKNEEQDKRLDQNDVDQSVQNGRLDNLEDDMKKNYGEHKDLKTGIDQAKSDAKDAGESAHKAQNTADRALDLGNSNQDDIDKNTRDISHNKSDINQLRDTQDKDRDTTKSKFDQVKQVQDKDRQDSKDQTAKTIARQDETDRRVGKLRDRQDATDKSVGTLNDRADATDQTLAGHEDKLNNHEGRITTLEEGQDKQDQRIGSNETNITNLQNGQTDQSKQIAANKDAAAKAQQDATDAGKIADRADDRSIANRNELTNQGQRISATEKTGSENRNRIDQNSDKIEQNRKGVEQAKLDAARADAKADRAEGKADDAWDYAADVDGKAIEAGNSADRANSKADANTDRLNTLAPTVADNTQRIGSLEDGQKVQDDRANKQQTQIDGNTSRLDQNDVDQKVQNDRISATEKGLSDNFAEHKVLDKKATDAQSTADKGVKDAATAQTTADKGVKDAASAQAAGNKGIADAAKAQSTANTANDKADTLSGRVDGHDAKFAQVDADQKVQDGKIDGLTAEQIKHNQLINQNAAAAKAAQASGDKANGKADVLADRADKADAKFATIDESQKVQDQRIADGEAAVLEAQSTADAGLATAQDAEAGVVAANGRLDNHNGRITTLEGQTAANSEGVKDAKLVAGKASTKADAAQVEAANANLQSRAANAKAGVALENTYINSDRIDALNGRVGEGLKTAEHNAVTRSNAYTDARFNDADRKINSVKKEANRGIAGVAAMANIPQIANKEWTAGIGFGSYNNESSLAIGGIYQPKQDTAFKASIATSNGGDTVVGLGASFGW